MKSNNRRTTEPTAADRPRIRRHPVRRPVNSLSGRTIRRPLPLALVISLDILIIGVGLVIFALFHHVLPRDVGIAGQVLPQQTVGTPTRSADSSLRTTDPLTGLTDGPLSTTSSPTTAAATATTSRTVPSESVNPTTSAATTPASSTSAGRFADKFKDKFTTGAVERTETSYKSAHVNVTVKKVQTGNVAYVVTDIYVSDIRYFRSAFASGKFARGVTDTVLSMATANKSIAAISGDYYGIRDKGIVIRNGVLYRDIPYKDVLIMNNDGSMQTFTAAGFNMDSVLKQGAWQGWSFGPMLLTDGKPMTSFNSDVTVANPRGAIGYFEPGHYCFVLVDGRQDGYSDGLTMKQLSQLFFDLGCTVAYNLDGGQSAVLTFMDTVANSPYKGGRKISDIVYIADQ